MKTIITWSTLFDNTINLLANQNNINCKEIVSNILERFKIFGIKITIKINFLHSHLDCFPENLVHVSDEHG